MSTNVGAIDMELLLNSNPFNQGIKNAGNTIQNSGIEGSLKKIGKLAVAAFSVKAIVNFTKECLKLGSDLAEVQNVVDVTFGNLNSEVDNFAQNAIDKFGLGQTITKKYVGTFGAMAKAFNFNNKEALAMSETLTGLAGDVASFYNLSSDEAYTKLKSVFTGETETLKDLGVVMTQNALDQYALANGYGKTTAKMSEQEKVALRYKFVLDKLSLANGDFERTSDSWANQTRVLSLRFDELKATLGQGFINIFTPIVKGINWVISKLQVLANAFKSFTEMIFGNAGGDDSSSSVSNLATDASNASDAVSGIGDSAKKAKKDLLGLRGIDEINNLSTSDDSDSSGKGSIDTSGFGNIVDSSMQQANKGMDAFIGKAKELVSVFKQGFSEGFGYFDWNGFKSNLSGIKENLIDIFNNPKVKNAASNWANAVMLDFGRVAGSIASIGMTIADNLVGGINKFLSQNKEDLQNHIVRLFDLSSRSHEISGKFAVTVADIFTVFRSDKAKQITADLLAIFTDSFLGVTEIAWQAGNDIVYMITEPINENKDSIKQTLLNMLNPISQVLGTIKQGVQDTFSKFWETYETYIAPAVENIKNGFSSILATILNLYNEHLKPILDEWGEKFTILWQEHIQPMLNQLLEFVGKLINGWSELWKTWIQPFVEWVIANIVPVLVPIFETIGNVVRNVFGIICDIISGVLRTLGGLIDFVVGVFTGDWSKAWQGIKDIFGGIWDVIKGIFEGVWNTIKDIFSGAIEYIKKLISLFGNTISTIWSNIWNGIKNVASNIWNGIKGIFSGVGSWFSNIFQQAYNGITRVFSNIGNFFSNIWNSIKNTFSNLGTSIGNAISNAVKSGINGVISLIERTINRAISMINSAIGIINLIPGVNIGRISSLYLPRLAQGGYVKANTPQLAMIGDNRHQGEVVAPEDKLHSIMAEELSKFQGTGNNSEVVSLLKEILKYLRNLGGDTVLNVDNIELARAVIKGMKALQSKSDKPILDFI